MEHIGATIEAYVDDIMVKTKKVNNLVDDLNVTFKCLRAKNIRLNLEKCVFSVPRGMLLGFIVSKRGIEANPKKIAAITYRGSRAALWPSVASSLASTKRRSLCIVS
jgi:hypothetical protein